MFSTFGQPTQSPSPVVNPFAPKPGAAAATFGFGSGGDANHQAKSQRKTPFGGDGDSNSTTKASNPFSTTESNLSDGGKQKKKKRGAEKETAGAGANLKPPKARVASQKALQTNARFANGLRQPTPSEDESRPTSSSSASSVDAEPSPAFNYNDPHARKVYEQLRRDNIAPPQWPSNPGNPNNKAAMAKFREQYEAYRDKVRVSLTKAGLIDDPDKRKALSDAINFKGVCEDMCPEYEKITRITEVDVYQPEKDRATKYANTSRMVKKLARSAAGQEAPLPMDVRSVPALRRTLDYLVDKVLRNDGNLPVLHGFLWDRTRAIRRDFSFFSSMTPDELKTQVYILENIARFHVTSLHLLSQEGKAGEDFVQQQELEQLGKSLLSLRDLYDDCNGQGIHCENETEFRAFYLIFHGQDPNMIEVLQRQWKPDFWRDSDEIRTAVSLVEALQTTKDFHGPLDPAPSLAASAAYNSYFRILDDPKVSYTMACFAECHFPHIRRSILGSVKRAFSRPKESTKDITAAVLNKFLRFDTIQQAVDFAKLHDLEFAPDEQYPTDLSRQYLVLNNRGPLPHPRLQHQYSATLVEKKRGQRSLPDIIHQTIFQDPNTTAMPGGSTEESLFVQDAKPVTTQQQTTTASPFSFASASAGLSQNGLASNQTVPAQNTITAPKSSEQLAPEGNPFASLNSASTASKPNPFGPSTASISPSPFSINPGQASLKPQEKQSGESVGQQLPLPGLLSTGPVSTVPSTVKNPFMNTAPSTSPKTEPPKFSFPSVQPTEAKPLATPIPEPLKSNELQTQLPGLSDSTKSPFQPSPLLNQLPNTTGATATNQSPLPAFAPPSTAQKSGGALSAVPPTAQTPSIGGKQGSSGPLQLPPPSPSLSKSAVTSYNGSETISSTTKAKIDTKPTVSFKPPAAIPTRPRDLMGDFTKWFVQGDKGLLSEFQVFMVEDLLRGLYDSYVVEAEEKQRKEQEERDRAEADKFRTYNLSLRYFYRWKDKARELRLRTLRRSGREQMRAFYVTQQAAHAKTQKDAARQAAREKAEVDALNRPEEFKHVLKHQRDYVSAGRTDPHRSSKRVLHNMDPPPRRPALTSRDSIRSTRSPSVSSSGGGAKTRALREELLGGEPSRFRRSLPPMATASENGESSRRVSGVSERWRLKAMGIVQLPDGTAVPESLARGMPYAGYKRPGTSSDYRPGSRRASISGGAKTPSRPSTSNPYMAWGATSADAMASAANKRKRSTGDDGRPLDDSSAGNTHKRVMSDAEKLVSELRALREEMEEGATWFKSQNERLQSEISSRGGTPWEDEPSV